MAFSFSILKAGWKSGAKKMKMYLFHFPEKKNKKKCKSKGLRVEIGPFFQFSAALSRGFLVF